MQQKKIKILETIRQGKIGGGESHVLDLVTSLDKSEFDVVVLSFTDGPMITALQEMGIPVYVIATERAFDISIWPQIKRFIKAQKIDIVHAHGTRANTNILWAARRLKLPVIYTIHGWSFHEGLRPLVKRARIAAEKFITRMAQVNICVSEANRNTGQSVFGGFRAMVIKNGINLDKFNYKSVYPEVKSAYGIPQDHLVVGYIARMTLQKDPVNMIKAFAEVLQQVSKVTLMMIGEGDLKQSAMAMANTLGIAGNVVFDDFRRDVPAVLSAMDIYCLPSLWEGFPIGVLEAMAMGKAVIATDVDGTREAVQHEENGLLIPSGNPSALAREIIRLAEDTTLRRRLQHSAVTTVYAKYNVNEVTKKIEAVYHQLLKQ